MVPLFNQNASREFLLWNFCPTLVEARAPKYALYNSDNWYVKSPGTFFRHFIVTLS